MHFIVLIRLRRKLTKEITSKVDKIIKEQPSGFKIHSIFWTLGRYDVVWHAEALNEKAVMAVLLQLGEDIATETLVAVPREEALKLLK